MSDFRGWIKFCVWLLAGTLPVDASPLLAESVRDGLYSSKMESVPSLLPESMRKSVAAEMKRVAEAHRQCVKQLTKDGVKLDCELPSAADEFTPLRLLVAERSLLSFLREERRLLELLVLRADAKQAEPLWDAYRRRKGSGQEDRRFMDARDVYVMRIREELDGMFLAYDNLRCGDGSTGAMPDSADMGKWETWVLANLGMAYQRAGILAGKMNSNGK